MNIWTRIKTWLQRLRDKITNPPVDLRPADPGAPVAPPPPADPVTPPPTSTADAVPYDRLRWTFGGENRARAVLNSPRIADLRFNGMSGLSYRWAAGDLSAWGIPHTDPAALACLFVRGVDGKWIGGKFDWISSSRLTRDFKNIASGYKGWSLAGVPNPCQAAFVIVYGDVRTNVITAEWRR